MPITVTSRGRTFTFKDGTTQEQIGEALSGFFAGQTKPVEKQEVGVGTALKRAVTEDVPYGLSNAADLLAGGLANLVGGKKASDPIFENLYKRTAEREATQRKRQETETQGTAAKIAQGVVGGLPQMLTQHATQATENVFRNGDTRSNLGALGVDTGAAMANMAAGLLGKGRVGTAAAAAGTSVPISMAQDAVNKRILAGTEAEQSYDRTGEDYLTDAIVSGVMGAAFPNRGGTKKTKADAAKEETLRQKEAEYAARTTAASVKAKVENPDLKPTNLDADGPYGMQYEMAMPGAKGTKKGKKAYEERQKAKGVVEEDVPQSEMEPNPDQLDMFVEDNKKVVEQTLAGEMNDADFARALEDSHKYAASQDEALIEATRVQEQLETGQQQTFLNETDTIKKLQEDSAWEQFKAQQQTENVESWRKGITELAEANKMEDQYLGLQDYLSKEPAVNYGMGKKTRDFLEQEAMQTAFKRRGQQGGFINPSVFAEGILKGLDIFAKGIKAYVPFAKKMIDAFGNTIKPALKDLFHSTRKAEGLGIVGKWSAPVHDLATKLKYTKGDSRLSDALAKVDSAVASVKESFRTKFYDEQFDPTRLVGSGAKFGDKSGLYNFLTNPSTDMMLEKTKHLWNRAEPATLDELKHLDADEKMAFFDLRKVLDEAAIEDGIDPTANPNYMPRMRLGDFVVMARNPDGSLHVEATDSLTGVGKLKRQLKAEGKTVIHEASGLANDVYKSKEVQKLTGYKGGKGKLGDVFESHRKIAENISGYSGQRDVRQMKDAIAIYVNQLEKSKIKQALEDIMPELDALVTDADQYDRLLRYMRTEAGLGFMYEGSFIKDTLDTAARALPPAAKIPGMVRAIGQVFNSVYVMAHVSNIIQAVTSPVFAMTQLARMGGANEVAPFKAMSQLGGTAMRSLLNMSTPLEKSLANRAIAAGYLENPADIVGIERHTKWKRTIDTLKDVSRASRLEFGIRADTFIGMYQYYIKDVGLSDKEAFDAAGQFVRKAFVGIREADRAPWAQTTGRLAPLLASLSTYPVGMAGKLYASMGISKPQVLALSSIIATSMLAGGLRGSPAADIGALLVYAANMFGEEEEAVKTFDDMMIEYTKNHPKAALWINGSISEALGVDMSRSLGWPGLSMLIPGGHAAQELLTGGNAGKGLVPLVALARAGQGAGTLLQNQFGDKALTPGEKQQAWKQVLPRGASQLMSEREIYDTRGGDLLGTVSQESLDSARRFGSQSLEERSMRSLEGTKSERQRRITQLAKDTTAQLVKSVLYEERPEAMERQLDSAIAKFDKLAKNGIVIDTDTLTGALEQQLLDTYLTREEREMVSKQLAGILLRQTMEGDIEQ